MAIAHDIIGAGRVEKEYQVQWPEEEGVEPARRYADIAVSDGLFEWEVHVHGVIHGLLHILLFKTTSSL